MSIVGVFDGHGGKRCSRYAALHLPENFYAALGEMHSRAKSDSDKEDVMGSALRLAYRITHEDFARMARGDAETARPKTRQRLQEALDKAKAFDGIGFGGGGGGQGGIANAMHRSFPQPEARGCLLCFVVFKYTRRHVNCAFCILSPSSLCLYFPVDGDMGYYYAFPARGVRKHTQC